MSNFIRNHNKGYGECVPAGIFNVCNYFGAGLKRNRDFDSIRMMVNHIPYEGTSIKDYEQIVYDLFQVDEIKCPKLFEIDMALEAGRVVLIRYRWANGEDRGNHVAVIIGKTRKFYRCLNYLQGITEGLVSRKRVAVDLRPKLVTSGRRMYEPKAYLIKEFR